MSRSLLHVCVLVLILNFPSSIASKCPIDLIPDHVLKEILHSLPPDHHQAAFRVCRRFKSMFQEKVRFGRIVRYCDNFDNFAIEFKSLLPFIKLHENFQNEITDERLVSIYDRLMYEAGSDPDQIQANQIILNELVDDILKKYNLKFLLTGLYLSDEKDQDQKCSIMNRRLKSELNKEIYGYQDTVAAYLSLLCSRDYINDKLMRDMLSFYQNIPHVLPLFFRSGSVPVLALLQCGVRYNLNEVAHQPNHSHYLIRSGFTLYTFTFLRGSLLDDHDHGPSLSPIIVDFIRDPIWEPPLLYHLLRMPTVLSHLRRNMDDFKIELAKIKHIQRKNRKIVKVLSMPGYGRY